MAFASVTLTVDLHQTLACLSNSWGHPLPNLALEKSAS